MLPLTATWKVWAAIFAFGALWWVALVVGISNTVSLAVAGGGLISIGAIRAGRAMREDAANFDAFRAGEPSDETHLAKLRYLEAVRRVLNREASDRDWTLINEYHERTPVA